MTLTDVKTEGVHEGHPAERRMVRFDWSGTPLHWVPDDPFSTHMINVLHLASAGIDSAPFTERLEGWFARIGSPKPNWPRPLQRWWLHRRLAEVAAIEHFTAVLGQWVIQNRGLDYAGADPMMLDLLRWHGAEEVEHRSLVYDVYQNLCGSYLLRAAGMLFVAPALLGWWLAGVRHLMAEDPTVATKPTWRDWLRAARQYRVPGPWMLVVTTPVRYLRPHHHPVREASTELAMQYLAQSPAARKAREAGTSAASEADGRRRGKERAAGPEPDPAVAAYERSASTS